MYHSNVSFGLWLQNFITLLLVSTSSYLILSRKVFLKTNGSIIIFVGILLLLITFVDRRLSNVHRWLSIGFVILNIGSIVLPVLLIELGKVLNFNNWWLITLLGFGIVAILLFQPDASKVTAVSLALLYFLKKFVTKKIQYVILALPIIASVWTWYFLEIYHQLNM